VLDIYFVVHESKVAAIQANHTVILGITAALPFDSVGVYRQVSVHRLAAASRERSGPSSFASS